MHSVPVLPMTLTFAYFGCFGHFSHFRLLNIVSNS